MNRLLKIIKRIERCAYPVCFQQMQDIKTMSDLYCYCESEDIKILTGSGWYCILAFEDTTCEIVDLASHSCEDNIFEILKRIVGHIPPTIEMITGDFRDSTSGRLLKVVKRYGWNIRSKESYEWNSEVFHDIILTKI